MKVEGLCHSRNKCKSESRFKFQSENLSCLSNLLSKNLLSLSTDSDIKAYLNCEKYGHEGNDKSQCQGERDVSRER